MRLSWTRASSGRVISFESQERPFPHMNAINTFFTELGALFAKIAALPGQAMSGDAVAWLLIALLGFVAFFLVVVIRGSKNKVGEGFPGPVHIAIGFVTN